MTKRILLALLALVVVVGILGGIKTLQIKRMIAQGQQFSPPDEPVNTAVVRRETWESILTAVGSLDAVQGVTVTAELPGKVASIEFEPGSKVKAGDLLLQQDISSEAAQLRAAEAALTLARIDLDRKRKLLGQEDHFPLGIRQRRGPVQTGRGPGRRPPGHHRRRKPSARPSPAAWASAWSTWARSLRPASRSSRSSRSIRSTSISPAAAAAGPGQNRHDRAGDHRCPTRAGRSRAPSRPSIPRWTPPPATSGCRPPWPT